MARRFTARFNEADIRSLRAAIKRNPETVRTEVANFITRGIRAYNEVILRAPWRVGASGGGSPVAMIRGGNLRDTHRREVSQFEGRITPTAYYARYVHEGTHKMKARPWLDYAVSTAQARIAELERVLLDNVTKDLAV